MKKLNNRKTMKLKKKYKVQLAYIKANNKIMNKLKKYK